MRVAVITPYYREPPDVLRLCHDSVARQTHPCRHYMVADGFPEPVVSTWPVEHLQLPRPHNDVGNAARCIGAMAAAGDGVDAVAFLDADNWYHDDHIESLVALHQCTGALVCTSGRNIHRVDGSVLIAGGETGDGETHADTSSLWIHRRAFEVLSLWTAMPPPLGAIGDRVIWAAIMARKIPRAHSGRATMAYQSRYAAHYLAAGEPPPENAKGNDDLMSAFRLWEALPAETKTLILHGYRASQLPAKTNGAQ
ncbi:MAG TPA: glycosyltransferase [Vineibacter sp.]|nr:glycosyltransferase [Vineibacter sp.]